MKKESKKLGIVALLLVLCLSLFTACGGPKNLEEAFDDPDVQKELATIEGSGVTVTAEDNTLVYTYKYSDTYDFSDESIRKQVVEALESGTKDNESVFKSVAESLEESTGLKGIAVKVVYTDSKDAVLYENTFEFK